MPGKTNSDAIRELEKTAAVLGERLDNSLKDIEISRFEQKKHTDSAHQLEMRLTVLEQKFADLKTSLEETGRKRWQIWLALIGAGLSLAGNVALWLARNGSGR